MNHVDARERFSVVSFVWAPGQKTAIHDHTVWGDRRFVSGYSNATLPNLWSQTSDI